VVIFIEKLSVDHVLHVSIAKLDPMHLMAKTVIGRGVSSGEFEAELLEHRCEPSSDASLHLTVVVCDCDLTEELTVIANHFMVQTSAQFGPSRSPLNERLHRLYKDHGKERANKRNDQCFDPF